MKKPKYKDIRRITRKNQKLRIQGHRHKKPKSHLKLLLQDKISRL